MVAITFPYVSVDYIFDRKNYNVVLYPETSCEVKLEIFKYETNEEWHFTLFKKCNLLCFIVFQTLKI